MDAFVLRRVVTTFGRGLASTLCANEISAIVRRCSALGSFDCATRLLGFLARHHSAGIFLRDADGVGGRCTAGLIRS